MASLSIKSIASSCLDADPPLSVRRDVFGYIWGAMDRTLSVKKHLKRIRGTSHNLSLILVAHEDDFSGEFDQADTQRMQAGIDVMRELYAQVGVGVRKLYWSRIPVADANGHTVVDAAEATDLTEEWSGANDGIDVFFVTTITDAGGWSNSNGPCDKDESGRTGAVLELKSTDQMMGVLLAHEVGHYLGLAHAGDITNVMGDDADGDGIGSIDEGSVNLTTSQGNTNEVPLLDPVGLLTGGGDHMVKKKKRPQPRARKSAARKPAARKPSDDLLNAIAANRLGCFVDLPRLKAPDVAVLKRILDGKEEAPVPVDRKRALATLARSAPSAETSEILARVVATRDEARGVRAAAAHYLSEMPPAIAEPALLASLAVEDDVVRQEVFTSLGVVGSAAGLKRLQSLPAPETAESRRQLEFARLMIGVRVSPAGVDPGSALGVAWATQEVKPITAKRVQERLRALHDATYRVDLNRDVGFEIQCGRTTHVVLMNATLTRGSYVKQLQARGMVAALVALAEEKVEHLTIRYIVLTSPTPTGVSVIVARSTGEAVYAGEAVADGGGLRLELRDVGPERIPTEISGTISDREIRFEVRVWRGAVRPKRRPLAISR